MAMFGKKTNQMTSMLESELRDGSDTQGEALNITDALLHEYWAADVDWKQLHRNFAKRETSIPGYGTEPYWISERGKLVPLSVLAFQGSGKRLAHARRGSSTDETLVLLANDPEAGVAAAAGQVLESRYPGGRGFPF